MNGLSHHSCGNADRGTTGRYVTEHNRICSDRDIVTDGYTAQDFCTGADIDSIADFRRLPWLVRITVAYRYSLANSAIVTYLGQPVQYDAAKVFNDKTSSDHDPCGYTYAKAQLRELQQTIMNKAGRHSYPAHLDVDASVTKSIDLQGPKTLCGYTFPITSQVFKKARSDRPHETVVVLQAT
jgi:hypothetical protein